MTDLLRVCLLALVLGCTPSSPAKHPDHGKVAKAHIAWCEMLAQADGEKLSGWRHREGCEAAYPAASAAFLERFNRCYANALKEYGENAPDSGALTAECSHKILGGADPGDVSHTALYKARCARQERCQKVSGDVCAGTWGRLDGFTQSLLSSKYNLGAQAEIAACLDDKDCEEDDAAVESACYDAAHNKLVWLPLSLGHDSSLGPKTD
jgi:hypothetical protein